MILLALHQLMQVRKILPIYIFALSKSKNEHDFFVPAELLLSFRRITEDPRERREMAKRALGHDAG